MFVYWYENRKDGFDEERALDLFIVSIFSGVVLSRFTYAVLESFGLVDLLKHVFYFWHSGFDPLGLAIGLLFPISLFTRSWKWSIYRVRDIFVTSLSFGLVFLLSGLYLITEYTPYINIAALYTLASILMLYFRAKVRSGWVFSLFLISNVIIGSLLNLTPIYLIFYVALITISISNLYIREKKNPMSSKFSANFIKKMKNILSSRKRSLENEQQLLLAEDPYMTEGRDSDNADPLDDVQEDSEKEVHDLRLKGIEKNLQSVSKAIAKIEDDSYGVCEVCGNHISQERLSAFPEATKCKNCAAKAA